MSAPAEPTGFASRAFRTRLLLAMMGVVIAVSAIGLYFADASATNEVEQNLQRQFQTQVSGLHQLQEIRHAALVERCRALIRKPRIHAALEDNALDLLYPSAKDELQDLMDDEEQSPADSVQGLRARFYRFLDHDGNLIRAQNPEQAGALPIAEAEQLALPHLPDRQQIGYIPVTGPQGPSLVETIAMPIRSSETSELISAIVLGFRPLGLGGTSNTGIRSGVWVNDQLFISGVSDATRAALTTAVSDAIKQGRSGSSLPAKLDGVRSLLVYTQLNPDSLYPPAYEVCLYPLTELEVRRAHLRWQILGSGALLLFVGLVSSHLLSLRLSAPVEKLAVDSAKNLERRERAEAALESTSAELHRSARFSADASHQLKTPVTVLRAGLEELLARPNLTVEECNELAGLVHQTYRLNSIIEDLLLLSRMDAGRLKLELAPVNLSQLIEGWLDDLSALPDPLQLTIESDFPPRLHVEGEMRYTTLILQNLLENARKYNCAGGKIRIAAHVEDEWVLLTVGNTGRPIPRGAQEHIFERFHRGAAAGNIPGHGLGLNLARELARLHKGDLRLARSEENWTEFEVRFLAVAQPAKPSPVGA
ncbi:MAG TPA: HAMP domain-containing sensor histidine kinase [Opitutaceae bacterium]|nr:HAMP domain-containing sensor histidine kinase [Opitutaceae bacterium]